MPYTIRPLSCDPARIPGMSERLIISHYENNYGGAVKRLNLIEEQIAELDYTKAPGFVINGLKREELIAMNSMILHELFFDGLGDQSEPAAGLRDALTHDFGSYERWRAEFIAMGKALAGGSGWVLLSWSPRDRKLVNQWASDHCHTLAGGVPILALDMYEHSYQIDFGAKAATYVDTFMLRGYVYERDPLAQRRAPADHLVQPNRGRSKDLSTGEVIMRVFGMLVVAALVSVTTTAQAQDLDWKKVDEALGRTGAVSGDVHRYGFPRGDLQVTLDGVTIRPALALGGWAAFKPAHGGAMVMGDLVLLETEINPVMSKLIENGLEVTAVHNHILRANPATFYMHIGGHGDPVKLATAIRTALAESKTPLATPAPAAPQPAIDLDTAQLDQIIGTKGQANGGVYQLAVPRRDAVTEGGVQLAPPGPTGVATAINFQPTGGGKAAITGDFVLTAEEVNEVIKALRTSGIEVTALHSHMLDEQPRLLFMHFWANDDALKLARGLRAALDKTARAKS